MSHEGKLDPDEVGRLFSDHARELTRFLTGVGGDAQLANDAVQISFAKLVESGGPDKAESRKAWLFRVAYNELLAIRRRQAVGKRVTRGLQWLHDGEQRAAETPLLEREQIDAVRQAIAELPENQRQIVRLRIYDEKTFAEIAEQLDIPLGTALTRMRSAMGKLRKSLQQLSPRGE